MCAVTTGWLGLGVLGWRFPCMGRIVPLPWLWVNADLFKCVVFECFTERQSTTCNCWETSKLRPSSLKSTELLPESQAWMGRAIHPWTLSPEMLRTLLPRADRGRGWRGGPSPAAPPLPPLSPTRDCGTHGLSRVVWLQDTLSHLPNVSQAGRGYIRLSDWQGFYLALQGSVLLCYA